ncbi:ATPase [bacterium]|nr:MAG: ATPase [bacterium]RKZ27458.1 MAG: ATPase [bacterium]
MGIRGELYRKKEKDNHLDDPYLTQIKYDDPTLCPSCGAVYHNKHWTLDEKIKEKVLSRQYAEKLCPACRKIRDRYVMGWVEIRGSFFEKHREDIMNTIKREEERAWKKNPLEKIISIKEEGDRVVIETTTESLATRLGRILHRSYKGKLDYKFSDEAKFVRLIWEREA